MEKSMANKYAIVGHLQFENISVINIGIYFKNILLFPILPF